LDAVVLRSLRIGDRQTVAVQFDQVAADGAHGTEWGTVIHLLLETAMREPHADLELLAGRFLRRFSIQVDKNIQGFDLKTLDILKNYPFPGNVRELRNAMERAVTFCDGTTILPAHLPSRIRDHGGQPALQSAPLLTAMAVDGEHLPTLAQAEHHYIRHVLDAVHGNKRRAAAILDIHRRTLYRKLEQG